MKVDFFLAEVAGILLSGKPIRWASGSHCTFVVWFFVVVENGLPSQSRGKCLGLFLLELWQNLIIITYNYYY